MAKENPPRMIPTPGCKYVARGACDFAADHYAAGDPFDAAPYGFTEDQMLNLWRAALVDVAPAAPVEPPKK